MKKNTLNKNYIWYIILLGILIVPQIIWCIFGKYIPSGEAEYRILATMPEFPDSLESLEQYPARIEEYVNDHYPFRSILVRNNSRFSYYALKESATKKTVVGKDGWLFFGEDALDIPQYKGLFTYTDEELATIADNLVTTRDTLENQGIEFVVFIAPNKERVYSEFLPDYIKNYETPMACDQLVDYLRANTDLRVVWGYEELMKAKEDMPDKYFYYHKDTHWNRAGGYVGTHALLKELDIDTPWITEVSLHENNESQYDLARLMNMKSDLTGQDVDYDISGYEGGDFWKNEEVEAKVFEYYNEGMDDRRMFVIRDSFGGNMAPYLAAAFNYTYMIRYDLFEKNILEEQSPDIVVYEHIERKIDDLKEFVIR